MRSLLIHSWPKSHAPAALPFPTTEALLERLKPAADLTNQALARLVLRLRARYPISFPLRPNADAAALVSWLSEAGAVVGVSTPPPAPPTPAPQPLPVAAAASPAAPSFAPQKGDDRSR
jgi:hypothetical protein